MQATIFTRHLKQLFSAPHVLIAYTVFAVAVAIADFLILPLTSDRIRESLVPYTGWVASMSYSFTIFFSLAMIFQQEGRRSMRMTIAGLLALQIVFSSLSILGASGENFGNPYLTIKPMASDLDNFDPSSMDNDLLPSAHEPLLLREPKERRSLTSRRWRRRGSRLIYFKLDPGAPFL